MQCLSTFVSTKDTGESGNSINENSQNLNLKLDNQPLDKPKIGYDIEMNLDKKYKDIISELNKVYTDYEFALVYKTDLYRIYNIPELHSSIQICADDEKEFLCTIIDKLIIKSLTPPNTCNNCLTKIEPNDIIVFCQKCDKDMCVICASEDKCPYCDFVF